MMNEHSSFEKYTSHTLFEMVAKGLRKGHVCERWVGDCNMLTPGSSVFSSTSFSFCWAAQPGALRAQLSAGFGSHCLKLQQLTPNSKLTELPVAPEALFNAHLLPVSITFAPNSTHPQSRLSPDIFDQMHLFIDWQLGRRSICYNQLVVFPSFARSTNRQTKHRYKITLIGPKWSPIFYNTINNIKSSCPVGWGYRIHWLHLCRG